MNQLFRDLARTKAVLIDRGWTAETWIGGDGCVCLGAAVAIAVAGKMPEREIDDFLSTDERAIDCLEALADELGPERVRPADATLNLVASPWPARVRVIEWNDEITRTVAEVLELVDRAANAASAP